MRVILTTSAIIDGIVVQPTLPEHQYSGPGKFPVGQAPRTYFWNMSIIDKNLTVNT